MKFADSECPPVLPARWEGGSSDVWECSQGRSIADIPRPGPGRVGERSGGEMWQRPGIAVYTATRWVMPPPHIMSPESCEPSEFPFLRPAETLCCDSSLPSFSPAAVTAGTALALSLVQSKFVAIFSSYAKSNTAHYTCALCVLERTWCFFISRNIYFSFRIHSNIKQRNYIEWEFQFTNIRLI